MPRDVSGTYTLPAGNPVVTGTTISSTTHNSTLSDIASALTASLSIDGSVTAAKLATNAVTTAKIQDNAVTAIKILDANITTQKINDLAVTTAKIADLAVTTAKIAALAVTSAELASNAVTTAKILDANVTLPKIANIATDTLIGRSTAGTGEPETIACTAAGRALLDDASAAAQCTTLGLGTGNSPTFTALTLSNGQLVFPATQVPSAGANTLDDYEEGTWTPVLTFGTPGDLSVAYTTQTGQYVKIGKQVTLSLQILTSAFTHTTASGTCRITGAPFSPGAGELSIGTFRWRGITIASMVDIMTQISASSTTLFVVASQSGGSVTSISTTHMPTGGTVDFTCTITFGV